MQPNMDQDAMEKYIPFRFEQKFKKILEDSCEIVTYESIGTFLEDAYKNLMQGDKLSQKTINDLKTAGVSDNGVSIIDQAFQMIRKTYKKFISISQKRIKNLYNVLPDVVQDLKFNIYAFQNLLSVQAFCLFLEVNNYLKIQDKKTIQDKLDQLYTCQDDNLKQKVSEFLSKQFKNYDGYAEDFKEQIIDIFITRNQNFNQIKSTLVQCIFDPQEKDVSKLIKIFYSEEKIQQTLSQFLIRVKQFVQNYEKQKKIRYRWIVAKPTQNQALTKLYQLRNKLNKQQITKVVIGLNYQFFIKKKEQVTDQVIKAIYNIPKESDIKYCSRQSFENQQKNTENDNRSNQKKSDFNQDKPKPNKKNQNNFPLQGQINQINNQIKGIELLLKEHKQDCLQIIMRKLQIIIRLNKNQQIKNLSTKVQQLLKKYNLQFKFAERIQALQSQKQFKKCVSMVDNIRKDIFGLNLQHIKQVKKLIEARKQCQNGDAIILIGWTGVGKTTTINGLSGNQLVYAPQSKDFRPKNPQMAKIYKVSGGSMSQTRWANVSFVKSDWCTNKILIIDTPGLQDNRSSQVDITNNIATVKLIKKLDKAKIVICLSLLQLGDRSYDPLKKIIKGISKYLIQINNFANSITFVFGKGLTIQNFRKKFIEFKNQPFFEKQNWDKNQQQFIQILETKLNNYYNKQKIQVQIHDPSTHDYRSLYQCIMEGKWTNIPGDYISTSYSQSSIKDMDVCIQYLNNMAKRTLSLKEFELTQYYINQLKQLQVISSKQNLTIQLRRYCQQFLEGKITECEIFLEKFYNETAQTEYLDKFIQNKSFIAQAQKYQQFIKFVYDNKEKPYQKIVNLIQVNLQEDMKLLKDASSIEPKKRQKVLKSLKLIKKFKSQRQYGYYVKQIYTQNAAIVNKLFEILKQIKFDSAEWQKSVLKFRNMFSLQQNFISQIDDMKRLRDDILKAYFDSNPQQWQSIRKLLHQAKTKTLQGAFYPVCSSFVYKLNKIQQTHYVIREFVQPKTNSLMKQLHGLICFYQEQQKTIMNQLDLNNVQLVSIFSSNSREIYQILTKFDYSQMNLFIYQKQQQQTFNILKNKLREKIKWFEQEIQKLALRPQDIDIQGINENLNLALKTIQFINARKKLLVHQQSGAKQNPQNLRIIQRQRLFLETTIIQSNKNLKKILRKIQKTANICNVDEYEINNKLIVCFLVLKQFQFHFEHYFQNQKQNIQNVQKNLLQKIQEPLKQLEQVKFQTDYDYKQLYKMLSYMEKLDKRFQDLTNNAKGLSFLVNFKTNPQIRKVIQKALQKMKDDQKQFQSVKKLLQFNQQSKYPTKDSSQMQKINKQQNLNKLSYQLLQKSIKYIKSYKQIKQICFKFRSIKVVAEFSAVNSQELDYCQKINQRLQSIRDLLNNKLTMKGISRKQLSDLRKQFNFLNGVYQKVKDQSKHESYGDVEIKINQELMKYIASFQEQVGFLKEYYKKVKHGVEFQQLQKLLNHQDFKEDINKHKFNELLTYIQVQYNTQFHNFFIEVMTSQQKLQKIDLFINVHQFMHICQQSKYKDKFTFSHVLEQVCDSFFDSIGESYDRIYTIMSKGNKVNEYQLKKLMQKQNKIAYYLKDKYQAYKAKKGMKQNYEKTFAKNRQKLQQSIKTNYIKDGKVDIYFKQFYKNADADLQNLMKKSFLQRNKDQKVQLQNFLIQDHQKMYKLIQQKIQSLSNIPEELQQPVKQILYQINNKKTQLQLKLKNILEDYLAKKQPLKLLEQYSKAKSQKSEQFIAIVKQSIQNYFNQQIKEIDFKNISKMKEILIRNYKLIESTIFRLLNDDEFIKKCQKQFVQQTQIQANAAKQSVNQQLLDLKAKMIQNNPEQQFKIYNFKIIKQQSVKRAIQLLNLTQQSQILQNQNQQLKKIIGNLIKKQKVIFKQLSNKLADYKQKIYQNKKILKQQFVDLLRNCYSSKFVYENYLTFNTISTIQEKVETQDIEHFKSCIISIKKNIQEKYNQARNAKVSDYISNDTKERTEKKMRSIDEDIIFLDQFTEIFFQSSQIPNGISKQIQQNNLKNYNEFLLQTIDQVQNSFKFQKDIGRGQKARQNDLICTLIKENNFKAFPSAFVKEGQKLNSQITEKFKLSVNKIQDMIDGNQQKYKQLKKQLQLSIKNQKQLKDQKDKKQKLQKNKIQEDMKIQLKNKLKTVAYIEQQEKQKIKQIQKWAEGQKASRLGMIQISIKKQKQQIQKEQKSKRQKLQFQIQSLANQMVQQIIINRRARSYYSYQQVIKNYPVSIQNLMEKILTKYKKKFIGFLYTQIKKCQSSYSQLLVDQQSVFSSYQGLWFPDLTKGQTFDKLILQVPKIKDNPKKIQNLLTKYKAYQEIYNTILYDYRVSKDYMKSKKNIIQITLNYGQRLTKQYVNNGCSGVQRYALLAHIFALWTILKSDEDEQGNVTFVYKPHAGQILAIFLLLEFDQNNSSNKITKSMVQVSTGQGKSVILGALSAYLALVGFKVYQACYSLYLSQRDYKDFESLFTCLNIKDKIYYNIFPEIFKMMLDEDPNNTFKDKMQNFLNTKSVWQSIHNFLKNLLPSQKDKNSILLIDEADVFLDENYIGQSFYPGINIEGRSLKTLFDLLWKLNQDEKQLEPQKIIDTKQFQDFCNQLENQVFKKIVKNQVHGMIRDILNYREDDYTVLNGKIYYKQGDGLSDKIHYGYRTIWAYYHQHYVNGLITANELDKQIFIKLVIASFSYAKLPTYFKSILGVTGTLETMADSQKQILTKDFQVKKTYVQPSIYPKSNRIIQFTKCQNNNLFEQMIKSIANQHSQRRPIVIFFKTKSQAYNFFDCNEFRSFRDFASVVTHEVNPNDRDFRIQSATMEGRITLLTDDFSRGTDFKLKTKNAEKHPGLHVISSYLPKSFCDYIQLAGRAGRQGRNGSVKIFMVEQKVLSGSTKINIKDAENIIKQKDNKHWKTKITQIRAKMEIANAQHKKSTDLYNSNFSLDQVLQNLYNLNAQPQITKINSKTAICIDGTKSMAEVFTKVVAVVQSAIPDIYNVIKKAKVDCSFDIKFVIYRNYNSTQDKLIQSSNFQNNASNLKNWIGKISVDGGWANQAVQVCLNHLNSLPKLNQFIIIGDAKSNTAEQTKFKRQYSETKMGRKWNSKGFIETNYEEQLNKLIAKKVKGHSYYLNAYETKQFYQDLSRRTGGVCQQFKIDDKQANQQFINFVVNRIIQNLGDMLDPQTRQKIILIRKNMQKRKVYG